jgi:hypothetical protein
MSTIKIIFALLVLSLVSCGSSLTDETLIGEWSVTDFSIEGKTSAMVVESNKEIIMTVFYTFSENAKFNYYDNSTSTILHGKWTLSSGSKKLDLTFDDGASQSFNIESFNGDRLIMTLEVGELATMKYTLERHTSPL